MYLTENYNEELADLTAEITIKQKLIEGLEQSQRRLETMRQQYEDKLNVLMNRIRATQDERDKVHCIGGLVDFLNLCNFVLKVIQGNYNVRKHIHLKVRALIFLSKVALQFLTCTEFRFIFF